MIFLPGSGSETLTAGTIISRMQCCGVGPFSVGSGSGLWQVQKQPKVRLAP